MNASFGELVKMVLPFLAFLFGLVEFLKSALSLKGRAVTLVSFAVGVVMGMVVYTAYQYPEWGTQVAGLFFVLALGLVASGFYKFADGRLPKSGE